MIHYKLIILLLFFTATLAWACKPAPSAESDAADVISAVNAGNYDRAASYAEKLFGPKSKLDSVSVSKLCYLAIAMTRLSESAEHSHDFTAQALECYRAAMARDSVSAIGLFEAMPREDFQYYTLLRQLLAPIKAREAGVVYTVNEEGEDEIITLKDSING